MIASSKGKSINAQVFNMVYTEMVHMIWKERNLSVFENKSKQIEEIARQIDYICNIRAKNRVRSKLQQLAFWKVVDRLMVK